MTKRKIGISILSFLLMVFVGLGIYFSIPKTAKAAGETVTIADDYTAAGTKYSNVTFDNLTTDMAQGYHAAYGLVPAKTWGATLSDAGTGSITYELTADAGYAFNGLSVGATFKIGHQCGLYYWQNALPADQSEWTSPLKLGANFSIYVSTDNNNWTNVYREFDPNAVSGIPEFEERTRSTDVDSTIFTNASKLYVKFELFHFTPAEMPLTAYTTSIPLDRLGALLYKTSITATQDVKVGPPDVTISDNMLDASVANSFVEADGVNSENNNLNGHVTFGIIPTSSNWGALVNTTSGYVTYQLSSTKNYLLENATLTLTAKYFASRAEFADGNANILVSVSSDGVNYKTAYDWYATNGIDSNADAKTKSISLASYSAGKGVLLIKISLIVPEVSDVGLNLVPVCLLGVNITSTQIEDTETKTFVEHTYGGNDSGVNNLNSYNNIYSFDNLYNGNTVFAVIPSSAWGGFVDAGNGNLVYKIVAGENKLFSSLRIMLEYKLSSGADLEILVGADDASFTSVYKVSEKRAKAAYVNPYTKSESSAANGVYYQILDLDLSSFVDKTETAYIKLNVTHPVQNVSLGNLKFNLLTSRISGKVEEKQEGTGYLVYNTNGGSFATEPAKTYTVGETVTLPTPTKNLCEFAGWYDNKDLVGSPVTSIDTSVVKTYTLFAKWNVSDLDFNLSITGDGTGTVKLNDTAVLDGVYNYQAYTNVKLKIELTDTNSRLYYVKVNGEIKIIKDNEITFNNITENQNIEVCFIARATITGDMSVNYMSDSENYMGWKEYSYDYSDNLKMLYAVDAYALGPGRGNTGWITYKVVATDGKKFETMLLDFVAKCNHYFGTPSSYINYYVGYTDPVVNGYDSFELVHESIMGSTHNDKTRTLKNLNAQVIGKDEIYIQIRVYSYDNNWALIRSCAISSTYEKVETHIHYGNEAHGDFYETYDYSIVNKTAFSSDVIEIRDNYARLDDKIYTDAAYTVEFDANSVVDGDLELYVKVKYVSGNIVYNLDGGTNSALNPVDTYDAHENEIILEKPTKDGYIFIGWYVNADCTDSITKIVQGRTGNITLYCAWVKDEAPVIDVKGSITYVLNGGVNATENPTEYFYNELTALYEPTKADHVFIGWYLTEDFSGGKITEISATQTGDITLYAKFAKEYYDITYVLNGGTNDSSNPAKYKSGVGATIAPATKDGDFIFVGWYLTEDFSGEKITVISDEQTGDITLYAKFVDRYYNITYVLNGGTNNATNPAIYEYGVGAEIKNATHPDENQRFVGWYLTEDCSGEIVTEISATQTGNITLYAKFVNDNHSITYVLNGGTNHPDNPTSFRTEAGEIVLKDPVREDYVFEGWYSNDKFTGAKVGKINTAIDTDYVLYAKWTQRYFGITYVLNGGTNDPDNPTRYEYKVGITSFKNATKANARFLGWYEDEALTIKVTSISVNSAKDITLYAKFENIYKITYILEDGIENPNPTEFTAGAYIKLVSPVKEGYTFDGWYLEDGTKVEEIRGSEYSSDITLTAKWVEGTASGGSGCGSSLDSTMLTAAATLLLVACVCVMRLIRKKNNDKGERR